jgi:uncharacterized coiled-coil protein SlyX
MEYSETLLARMKELEATVKQQQSQIVDLEVNIEEKNKQISKLEGACLIQVFGKVRKGQHGATSWPLFVWELILEMLVNGTPRDIHPAFLPTYQNQGDTKYLDGLPRSHSSSGCRRDFSSI